MDNDTFRRLNREIDELGLFTLISRTERLKDGKEVTYVYRERSSKLWGLLNDKNQYDDKLAEELVNKNNERKADILFRRALMFVLSKGKLDDVLRDGPFRSLENLRWEQKVDWANWVLYRFESEDLRQVEEYEEIVDGQGDLVGMKRLPKARDDEVVEGVE